MKFFRFKTDPLKKKKKKTGECSSSVVDSDSIDRGNYYFY